MKVKLPAAVIQKPVGLGDVIKFVTAVVGVKPCGGCQKRAEKLNQKLTFAPVNLREPGAL